MSTKQLYIPDVPAVPAGESPHPTPVRPACESCGSRNTPHYMDAIRGVQPIDLYACLACNHRFSVPAQSTPQGEDQNLTQTEELASFEAVASARAQAEVACPICGCHCAGKR